MFPAGEFTTSEHVRITNILDVDTVEFLKDGGAVLLTDHFPGTANPENFRSHTSGRSLGHAGALFDPHPVWEKFPHSGFLDWQFFPMMRNSRSLLYDDSMPEFKPLFELIPSFKMVKHKSMLSEFIVGKGRLMISGLNFDISDPEKLMLCAANSGKTGNCGQKIDAGGRPIG